ncbi:MAG: hypothetical protein ACI4XH_04605 [Acutalibacteraceae bacterium]
MRTKERLDTVKNIIKNVAYGFISGIVIYVISMFFSELVYIKVSDKLFEFLLYVIIAVSAVFALLMLFLKNPPIPQMLVRFFSSAFFYVLFFIISAELRVIATIEEYFNFIVTSSSGNVSGMLLLIFLSVVVSLSVVAVIIKSILKVIRR